MTIPSDQAALDHVYTVELRFFGDTLDPLEVSKLLKLQPSSSLRAETNQLGPQKRRSFWAYNGHDKPGFQDEWSSLEQGLDFLLNTLASHRSVVVELSRRFNACWWCGHFQSGFDGGPILSPGLLARIADYGLPLAIDNYFSEAAQGGESAADQKDS